MHLFKCVCLEEVLVWDGSDQDGQVILDRDKVGRTRTDWLSLQLDERTGSLGFSSLLAVILDTGQEIETALGGTDVFNADTDALLHVTITDGLVNNDTKGTLSDVEDDTSLTMVELVRHTLLDGTISLNVHKIADLIGLHIGGKLD